MKSDDNVRQLCWEIFKETGEVSYYMLYKALDGDKEDKG